jgi:hypothetical protein
MEVQEYLDLITSEYQSQPDFSAMVEFMVSLPVQVQHLMTQMITTLFDLDTPPVGDQLDIIGRWAGVSRKVNIPITGVYFTWDGSDYTVGWDYGTWQPSNLPTSIVSLPDDAYLTLIKAKIAANNWDGTTNGAYEIWDLLFPQFTILIQDNCNMTYALAIIGGIVDSLTLALITGGYIQLRPEGVAISEYFVSTDTNPAFCWDIETPTCKGWDEGSWLRELAPTNTPF